MAGKTTNKNRVFIDSLKLVGAHQSTRNDHETDGKRIFLRIEIVQSSRKEREACLLEHVER